jgi:hypothetical protein
MRSLLLPVVVVLTGCPSADGNAPTLWLALDGRETEVKLAEEEPEPF